MILTSKIKEAATSVVPIMGLVWLLHMTIAPIGENFLKFVIGGVLLIMGLAIFLLGAEIGVVPIGHRAGSALTQYRNLPLLLGSGFAIGFFITIAEPDVHVLAQQVIAMVPGIDSLNLVLMIAAGVGLFVSIALARVVFQLSLRLLLFIFYLVVFICAYFTDSSFVGIAFDSGGATTGPMTVPFIMALGVGVASVRAKGGRDDSFGVIGIASIGPILAVLLLGFFNSGEGAAAAEAASHAASTVWGHFLAYVPEVAYEVGLALSPLVLLFVVFRLFLLSKMTLVRMMRTIMGLVYTYIGLVIFFIGVKGGFIPAGTSLGAILANHDASFLLLLTGFALGALAVFAEPAVWVLTKQVEDVSGGVIKSKILLIFLCVGVASAVALAMLRINLGLSLWPFILPGYLLTFILTLFCPPLFIAIAFDSGGVASGPMASTFILAFTLGAAHGGSAADAFGVIALIAMTPLIAIQVLGVLYRRRVTQK